MKPKPVTPVFLSEAIVPNLLRRKQAINVQPLREGAARTHMVVS